MPPAAQAVRLAGDAVMAYGAWRRRPGVMAAGLAAVALGWSHGLPGAAPSSSPRPGRQPPRTDLSRKRKLDRRRLVMKVRTRWLYVIAGLAAIFVAGSSIALAVRQGSWVPIVAVGWIPAVLVAAAGGRYRHSRRGRGGPAA
jgi:hypothetical protein